MAPTRYHSTVRSLSDLKTKPCPFRRGFFVYVLSHNLHADLDLFRMKILMIVFIAALVSACSLKELVYDMTDDDQLNALEADIDALSDSGQARVEERIEGLRAQLDVVRDAAKDRRDELARDLAAKIEFVKLLK